MKRTLKYPALLLLLVTAALYTAGCSGEEEPMPTVKNFDINRFMGRWFVIAHMPNFIENSAVNGIEQYDLRPDGDVNIRYSFRVNEPRGKKKTMKARGFVDRKGNPADWKVQFIWPLKLPYKIIDLDENYQYTVVGVPNRKYAWVMARTPRMDEPTFKGILARMKVLGYDVSNIKIMPQIWE